MDLIAPAVTAHLNALVPERPAEMQKMEAHAHKVGFPIIGPAAGHFCYLVARIAAARRIYELGSGFGYSTAWFARAVRENGGGVVHHVVWDEDLSRHARKHIEVLGYSDIVHYTVAEAVGALNEVEEEFDLIFVDIDKESYPASLDVIERRLRPGGVLIVDNVLWSGRIFDEADQSAATAGVRELTRRLTDAPAWTASIVPIRDGLMVAQWHGS